MNGMSDSLVVRWWKPRVLERFLTV